MSDQSKLKFENPKGTGGYYYLERPDGIKLSEKDIQKAIEDRSIPEKLDKWAEEVGIDSLFELLNKKMDFFYALVRDACLDWHKDADSRELTEESFIKVLETETIKNLGNERLFKLLKQGSPIRHHTEEPRSTFEEAVWHRNILIPALNTEAIAQLSDEQLFSLLKQDSFDSPSLAFDREAERGTPLEFLKTKAIQKMGPDAFYQVLSEPVRKGNVASDRTFIEKGIYFAAIGRADEQKKAGGEFDEKFNKAFREGNDKQLKGITKVLLKKLSSSQVETSLKRVLDGLIANELREVRDKIIEVTKKSGGEGRLPTGWFTEPFSEKGLKKAAGLIETAQLKEEGIVGSGKEFSANPNFYGPRGNDPVGAIPARQGR